MYWYKCVIFLKSYSVIPLLLDTFCRSASGDGREKEGKRLNERAVDCAISCFVRSNRTGRLVLENERKMCKGMLMRYNLVIQIWGRLLWKRFQEPKKLMTLFFHHFGCISRPTETCTFFVEQRNSFKPLLDRCETTSVLSLLCVRSFQIVDFKLPWEHRK